MKKKTSQLVKFSLLIPQDLGWIQAVKNSYSCCICPLVFLLFLGNKKKFQQANATAINTRMLPLFLFPSLTLNLAIITLHDTTALWKNVLTMSPIKAP